MIENSLTASLLALGSWLTRVGGRLMAPLGLTQQESVILIAVAETGPVSQKDLRSDLLLERSNVSKAVIHLEAMGLLTAAPGASDARVVLVTPTPAGHDLADQCLRVYQQWNRDWLSGIDERRLTDTLALLDEVRRRDPQQPLR